MKPFIDVCILTINRAELFEQSLRSVCNQTYQDFKIRVFDCASTDNTKEVFESISKEYPNREMIFNSADPENITQNVLRLKENVNSEYVVVFHDDDLMAPDYIETAVKVLKENSEVNLVVSGYKPSSYPENLLWEKKKGNFFIGKAPDLACLFVKSKPVCYPSAIYRTDIYKKTLCDNVKYGKADDRPFLLDNLKEGSFLYFPENYIHYRVHAGQDTNNQSNPFLEKHFISLLECYKTAILKGSEKHKKIYDEYAIFHITNLMQLEQSDKKDKSNFTFLFRFSEKGLLSTQNSQKISLPETKIKAFCILMFYRILTRMPFLPNKELIYSKKKYYRYIYKNFKNKMVSQKKEERLKNNE